MQLPNLEQLLIIDIETVSQHPRFEDMPERWQQLWVEKTAWQRKEGEDVSDFYTTRAAIMAEFGKIICICLGYFKPGQEGLEFRVKQFYSSDEKLLLQAFEKDTTQLIGARKLKPWFGGHNIREFDIPYLCRRYLINQLGLPAWLDFQAQKPWEVNHLDTLQWWKFGDFKHYTSLNLLTACMNIPSPKTDLDGSMVGKVYWESGSLDLIASYCARDVVAVAQLLLRFSGRPLLADHQITIV